MNYKIFSVNNPVKSISIICSKILQNLYEFFKICC